VNSEWIMVIITGIYVIATIIICWANIKSANASKEQLEEMQKQYAETNRPLIELEFQYNRRTWYIARFVNHGNLTAQRVKISLDQAFIDSVPEESFRNELERIKGKECIIGVGQHYDLFIGGNKLRGKSYLQRFPFSKLSDFDKDEICGEDFFEKYIATGGFVLFPEIMLCSENYIQKGDGSSRNSALISPLHYS